MIGIGPIVSEHETTLGLAWSISKI